MIRKLTIFVKKEAVLTASFCLAILSVFLIHPDRTYADYIDFRTLAILFCLMTVMEGLKKLRVFRQGGEYMISRVHTLRGLVTMLTLLCFFTSMLITNDVALITFVPFTIIVLEMTGQDNMLLRAAALETCAANLGSMLLPMGNPQNLYLYGLSGLSFSDFTALNAPYVLLALPALIILCLLLTPKAAVKPPSPGKYSRTSTEKIQLILYLILFAVSLSTVLRILDYRICFAVVLISAAISDKDILKKVDYSLLLTFVFLFIFIGNTGRITSVHTILSGIVSGHELISGILVSQFISNVPAAVLLSGFSSDLSALVIGVNIGGLGTLIASMANLISFRQIAAARPGNVRSYLFWFTGLCLLLLFLLSALALILHSV